MFILKTQKHLLFDKNKWLCWEMFIKKKIYCAKYQFYGVFLKKKEGKVEKLVYNKKKSVWGGGVFTKK
jgi:hypothetical protein